MMVVYGMRYLLMAIAFFLTLSVSGQTAAPAFDFIEYQRSFPRISEALKKKEDTLMKQFRAKKLEWPARNIYLRSFKYDSHLEVWIKPADRDQYQLFKTYKVCALAGTLGPKRMEGDYQVPEGFYYINEFNPKSAYHLSLGLNYPNASDRLLADSLQPGGDIYIHGKCITTGCIPILDQQIEELYVLALHAKNQGQDFIPVHIFPVQFNNPKSAAYLAKYVKEFPEYADMADELKRAYLYFEKTKKLPLIMVDGRGAYHVANAVPEEEKTPATPVKKAPRRPVKYFNEADLAKVVDKLPVYPGGNAGFQEFIDKASRDMEPFLEKGQQKTYLMVEFIIDQEGQPAYAKVIKGGNEEMNDKLQERFENMPLWTPATRLDKNVAVKLKQSIVVDASGQ